MNKGQTKPLDERIESCIKGFDFQKVEKFMRQVKWKWREHDGNEYSPTQADLVILANKLLRRVAEDEIISEIGTGGLLARKSAEGDLALEFVVTQAREEPF